MNKTILTIMIGVLLLGVNVFAAGDLIVNGRFGAGTSTLDAKVNVDTTDEAAMSVLGRKSSNTTWYTGAAVAAEGNAADNAAILGLSLSATSNTTAAETGGVNGITGVVKLNGSGTVTSAKGFINNVRLATSAGNYTVGTGAGQDINLTATSTLTGNHTITNYYGIHSRGVNLGASTIGGTNWRHMYFEDFPDFGGTVASVAGLWVDKQTYGTSNYGLVLNGDGAIGDYGAAVTLGANQNAYLYGKSDGVYVYDGIAETKISPHDPETGEWIYFSKNVKTGKVVRVDMARLVKAVEKLTGETFMVETLIEE